MKQIYPDFEQTLKNGYIARLAHLRKFKRLWGTEYKYDSFTDEVVEVYIMRRPYYKNMSKRVEKLVRFLGMYDDLSEKQKGIRSAWLYLNRKKGLTEVGDFDPLEVQAFLQASLARELSGYVLIEPKYDYKTGEVTPPPIPRVVDITPEEDDDRTPEEIQIGIIRDGFNQMWLDNYAIVSDLDSGDVGGGDDDYDDEPYDYHDEPYEYIDEEKVDIFKSLVILYILRTSHDSEISKVVETTVEFSEGITARGFEVHIKIPVFEATTSSELFNLMYTDLKPRAVNSPPPPVATINSIKAVEDFLDTDGIPPREFWARTESYKNIIEIPPPLPIEGEDEGEEEKEPPQPIIVESDHYGYQLRASFTENTELLNTEERLDYLYKLIDVGYKKKSNTLAKIASIVIIAVALYFAGPAAAGAMAAAGGGITGVVLAAAAFISTATFYVALASMASYLLGAESLSNALAQNSKGLNKLNRVAAVINLINAITEGAKMAMQKFTEEGIAKGIAQIGIELAKIVLPGLDLTSNSFTSNLTFRNMLTVANFGMQHYWKRDADKWEKRLNKEREELAELQKLEEASKTQNLLKLFSYTQFNQLRSQESEYANIYDVPYEPNQTEYHTGNTQVTEVTGLWSKMNKGERVQEAEVDINTGSPTTDSISLKVEV